MRMKYKLKHSKGKWRINDNSYIPISDMETDHIKRALFYTRNKVQEWKRRLENARLNIDIFEQKENELKLELQSRGESE